MNREQIEAAYAKTIEHLLEVAGNTTATFLPILGGKSIEITIASMEEYLRMLKELQQDYEKPSTNHSCMSPMLNDSMLVHRNRLSRTSKSRLTVFRASPTSPMEVDRMDASMTHIEAIQEESTLLDPTMMMDESTHQRGFLADVSDMNGTVRSRNPSFNFNYLSPVSSDKSRRSSILRNLQTTFDLDADVSSFMETSKSSRTMRHSRAHAGEEAELRTPRAANTTIDLTSDATPTSLNLWNVKLRPGSNRKIDNEIRNEIQRQLAREMAPSDQ